MIQWIIEFYALQSPITKKRIPALSWKKRAYLFDITSSTRAAMNYQCFLCHFLPYFALIFASISGVIVVASLNLAIASGVLNLFIIGEPLSIAFYRFLIPQSGLIVNVLLNDSIAMTIPPTF